MSLIRSTWCSKGRVTCQGSRGQGAGHVTVPGSACQAPYWVDGLMSLNASTWVDWGRTTWAAGAGHVHHHAQPHSPVPHIPPAGHVTAEPEVLWLAPNWVGA